MNNELYPIDAESLQDMPLMKAPFIIDTLLPQGVSIFSGAAKMGKSWLMLWVSLQVAAGQPVWGLKTKKCGVLYLCLEDTLHRVKDRLYQLTQCAPPNLYLSVSSEQIGNGLEGSLSLFLDNHPDIQLVIIDTLQKIRSPGKFGSTSMYASDYEDISVIKNLADERNLSIILIHHLRKMQDSTDHFNEVSGSTGITGAADTNFILRRKRGENTATLLVNGRDVEYQELQLQFKNLVWELVDRKGTEELRREQIPPFLFRVVEFMQSRREWEGVSTELLKAMGETATPPNMVTKYFGQYACEVLEPAGITYQLKRTSHSRLIHLMRNDSSCDGTPYIE